MADKTVTCTADIRNKNNAAVRRALCGWLLILATRFMCRAHRARVDVFTCLAARYAACYHCRAFLLSC